ncbi:MAG TPA: serine hydrolase domain-containing protein, partial [Steroidobacteraceae bacterium]|nr:serine hydrolase domain-containing protein [Steroidobacteraceae bacterium]
MRTAAAVLALVATAIATAGESDIAPRELTRGDLEAWLDGYFPYALARDDVAGAAVVVVRDGAVLAVRGYGHADVANGIRVDPARTLFRTGSVGKLFTWTAVMQQVEAGRLDLDRDVNDYLDFRIPPRDGKPVTLRNLMTHTPGFEEAIKRLVTDRPKRLATPEAYLKAWTPERIFPPGEVPAYSNYGVTLAGYLVERVSGESYDDYVERHVFGPLGMTQSTTRQVLPARFRVHVSQGYQLGSGPAQPFELFGVAPAGGATTTVTDMARFMLAWLQQGELGPARILRVETARRTLGTRLPIVPPLNGMLLGFYEQEPGGQGIAGHDGDTQFFHSALSLFVDRGIGVYVVVNSTGRDGAAGALLSTFMGEFMDRYFPSPAIEGMVGAQQAAAHARLMAGTYMSSRRQESNFFSALGFLGQTRVLLDDDGSLLIPALVDANGEPMDWREVRPFVWHQVGGKERLAARLKNGRVELISVDSASPFLVLQPAPWWKSSTIFLPLLVVALAVILASIVAWPATALLRRHYGLWPAHA